MHRFCSCIPLANARGSSPGPSLRALLLIALFLLTLPAFAAPADWLITARYVVTMDQQHRLIDNGAVAIRGERIVGIGPRAEIENSSRPLTASIAPPRS